VGKNGTTRSNIERIPIHGRHVFDELRVLYDHSATPHLQRPSETVGLFVDANLSHDKFTAKHCYAASEARPGGQPLHQDDVFGSNLNIIANLDGRQTFPRLFVPIIHHAEGRALIIDELLCQRAARIVARSVIKKRPWFEIYGPAICAREDRQWLTCYVGDSMTKLAERLEPSRKISRFTVEAARCIIWQRSIRGTRPCRAMQRRENSEAIQRQRGIKLVHDAGVAQRVVINPKLINPPIQILTEREDMVCTHPHGRIVGDIIRRNC
jgi:hypothetical protein